MWNWCFLRNFAACWVVVASAAAQDRGNADQYWPQWRGPRGTGFAPHADPPVQWSEVENVRWKIALPGLGHSTPVVWGNYVFLTLSVPYGDALEPKYSDAPGAHDNLPVTRRHEFFVLAVDRRDGSVLWQRSLRKALPHEGAHHTASLASNSPVTDGESLLVSFGSYGLYCLDLDGRLLWEKDLGRMNTKHGHGEGSSPALHGHTLIINWDHEGQSFVVALDKRTGRRRWKVDREEVTSWATPVVVQHQGKSQVIISGTSRVRGYDLDTGAVIWECGGLSANIVASPVAADGMVFVGSSYEKRALLAIRLDQAQGDITRTANVMWRRIRGTPYVPSPLLCGDSLYFLSVTIKEFSRAWMRRPAKIGPDKCAWDRSAMSTRRPWAPRAAYTSLTSMARPM